MLSPWLERRIALERGGRDDFSATLAAGVDGVRLPKQFHLDAYGQAGIIGHDGFADGAVRVDRRLVSYGKSEIALGAGVWGGAQPGLRASMSGHKSLSGRRLRAAICVLPANGGSALPAVHSRLPVLP